MHFFNSIFGDFYWWVNVQRNAYICCESSLNNTQTTDRIGSCDFFLSDDPLGRATIKPIHRKARLGKNASFLCHLINHTQAGRYRFRAIISVTGGNMSYQQLLEFFLISVYSRSISLVDWYYMHSKNETLYWTSEIVIMMFFLHMNYWSAFKCRCVMLYTLFVSKLPGLLVFANVRKSIDHYYLPTIEGRL